MPRATARFSLSDALLNVFEINERIRDGHHRGQDAMRPRQVGYGLPRKATFGMWEWGTR
ncbi:MAG: hypothetical protein WA628_16645 [Terriglobales bacterium]